MTSTKCLNCDKELVDKFCSGCGQKADTHRISFKNFIFHDLLHGAFHIERGMLFTAKQALLCPGTAALDYISGKRKRYYNVFLLVMLTIGVMLFTRHVTEYFVDDSAETVSQEVYMNKDSETIDRLITEKSKVILLLFVPFAALNSFILFRRKKLNLSEHFIISGMILLGILLISTIGNIIFHLNMLVHLSYMFLSVLVGASIFFYVGYGYVNAFANNYTKLGISYRILLFYALIFLEIVLLFCIVWGFVSHWKFGSISVSPFG